MVGWKELLIVLIIVLLVFGTKRLKNIGGDLGDAMRGFKKGLNPDEAGKADADKVESSLRDDSRKD